MAADDGFFTFWSAPDDALFSTPVVARVRGVAVATIERERWQKTGPKHLKVGGRVLYRKADVLAWIQQQAECA